MTENGFDTARISLIYLCFPPPSQSHRLGVGGRGAEPVIRDFITPHPFSPRLFPRGCRFWFISKMDQLNIELLSARMSSAWSGRWKCGGSVGNAQWCGAAVAGKLEILDACCYTHVVGPWGVAALHSSLRLVFIVWSSFHSKLSYSYILLNR